MKKLSRIIPFILLGIISVVFSGPQLGAVEVKPLEADVVVIGGGGAGTVAALNALQNGAGKVLLLEKEAQLGGTSATAGGFIWGAETHIQKAAGIDTDKDRAFNEHMEFNHYDWVDPKVVRAFIEKTAETTKWLDDNGEKYRVQGMGIMGEDAMYTQFPVDMTGGTHNFGRAINRLAERFTAGGGEILLNTRAEKIVRGQDGGINSVTASDKEGAQIVISTKSVILATGGFTGNEALLYKYFPDYWDSDAYVTLAVDSNTGDGIGLAKEAGAGLNDYATLIREPATTYFDGVESPAYSRLASSANIWVNKRGERFQDETWSGNEAINALLKQPDKIGFALFDEKSVRRLTGRLKSQGQDADVKAFYTEQAEKGLLVKISDNLEEIARWIGAEPDVLKATVAKYNSFCEQGRDAIFGKDPGQLNALLTAPYYAVKIGPLMIDTYGPVRINERMEVLDKEDKSIPGFYAGGAICGQIQGNDYHFFGGALGFAVTSGYMAGENAARYVRENER